MNKQKRQAELRALLEQAPRRSDPALSDLVAQQLTEALPGTHQKIAPMSVEEQQELLLQCQYGQRSAFNRLMRAYLDAIYTYLHQVLNDDSRAIPATQDVFITAHQQITNILPETPIKAWLFHLAEEQIRKYGGRTPPPSEAHPVDREPPSTAATGCQVFIQLLPAYIDNLLDDAQNSALETHLADCPDCQEAYAQMLDTTYLLRSAAGHLSAPESLQHEVIAAIDAVPPWQQAYRWLTAFISGFRQLTPQFVATMVVVCLISGVLYYSQSRHLLDVQRQNKQLREQVVRGTTLSQEPLITTFIIFTGELVSQGFPAEASSYITKIMPDPANAEMYFINGTISTVRDMIANQIHALQGTITDDELISEEKLTIHKIVVEVPQHSPDLFSRFLSQMEKTSEKETNLQEFRSVTLAIYIIEKL